MLLPLLIDFANAAAPLKIVFSAGLLILLFLCDLAKLLNRKLLILSIGAAFLFLFLSQTLVAASQYLLWQNDAVSRFLLPPHQPANYFISYAFTQFFFDLLITFLIAALITGFFFVVNKIFHQKIFYADEFLLMFLGFILVPWPSNFIMAVFLLMVIFVGTLFAKGERFSPRPLWLPAALVLFFASPVFSNVLWYFRFVR